MAPYAGGCASLRAPSAVTSGFCDNESHLRHRAVGQDPQSRHSQTIPLGFSVAYPFWWRFGKSGHGDFPCRILSEFPAAGLVAERGLNLDCFGMVQRAHEYIFIYANGT